MVYLHRFVFLARRAPPKRERLLLYAAVTLLAAKVTDHSIKSYKLADVFGNLASLCSPSSFPKELIEANLPQTAQEIELMEMVVLDDLGYNIDLDLPFAALEKFRPFLEKTSDGSKAFFKEILGCLNDFYKLPFCLNYTSAEIAASAIFFVKLYYNLDFSLAGSGDYWVRSFSKEVEMVKVHEICGIIKTFFKAHCDGKVGPVKGDPCYVEFGSNGLKSKFNRRN